VRCITFARRCVLLQSFSSVLFRCFFHFKTLGACSPIYLHLSNTTLPCRKLNNCFFGIFVTTLEALEVLCGCAHVHSPPYSSVNFHLTNESFHLRCDLSFVNGCLVSSSLQAYTPVCAPISRTFPVACLVCFPSYTMYPFQLFYLPSLQYVLDVARFQE
jgi:hypothetical protein